MTHHPITTGRIMEIALGALFVCISLVMMFGPAPFKIESGEGYIRLVMMICIGCGLLYFGIFPRKEDKTSGMRG